MNRDTHELLTTAFGNATHSLALWYAPLLTDGALRAFTADSAAKIRKKLRHAREPEALRDLQCELAVAAALADRRSPLIYEPLAAHGRRGPDFLLRHKGQTAVYVEVSRLRPARNPTADPMERLAAVLCGKLDQLASGAANLLVVFSDAGPFDAAAITTMLKMLQQRAAAKDDAYFAFRGLNGVRAFQQCLPRLSGVLLVAPAATDAPPGRLERLAHARRPLPPDLARSIVARIGARLFGIVGQAGIELSRPTCAFAQGMSPPEAATLSPVGTHARTTDQLRPRCAVHRPARRLRHQRPRGKLPAARPRLLGVGVCRRVRERDALM